MSVTECMFETVNIKSKLFDYSVDFISDFEETLSQLKGNLCYVIDRNVYELYRDKFSAVDLSKTFFIDATEEKKVIETIIELAEFWKNIKLQKDWKAVCFGGGISQDITTLASNIYLRNIDWYFFPTTLLAMSDSCIGGKSAINFKGAKNQLGVFYPPRKIFIDTKFIGTLTREDYINGWGEILKFSLTNDVDFYNELKAEPSYIPCERIGYYIRKGLLTKQNIIEQDEFEGGLRRILNFGHTFGHALEAYTKNAVPHGTAVLWGIDVSNYIAYREGKLDKAVYLEIKNLIKREFITQCVIAPPSNAHTEISNIVSADKKVLNNTLHLVIQDKLSSLSIYPIKLGNGYLEAILADYITETYEFYLNRKGTA